MRSLFLISSTAGSLDRFKGRLIRSLSERGVTVYAAAPDYDERSRNALRMLGATPIDIRLTRASLSPGRAVLDAMGIAQTIRRLRPDAIASVFLKPTVLLWCASFACRRTDRYVFIEGFGHYFTPPLRRGPWATVLRWVLLTAIRASVRSARLTFFLNAQDRAAGVGTRSFDRTLLLPGVGVDLSHYHAVAAAPARPTFVFIGRFLRAKGLVEFVQASTLVVDHCPTARFVVVGTVDDTIGALRTADIAALERVRHIEWAGSVVDVRPFLAGATACVLPSYREGAPRVLQEAMAMSTAIVTTDVTGCREMIDDGYNGILVPVCDTRALAAAMIRLAEDPHLAETMGTRGRERAESLYDEVWISAQMMKAMDMPATSEPESGTVDPA